MVIATRKAAAAARKKDGTEEHNAQVLPNAEPPESPQAQNKTVAPSTPELENTSSEGPTSDDLSPNVQPKAGTRTSAHKQQGITKHIITQQGNQLVLSPTNETADQQKKSTFTAPNILLPADAKFSQDPVSPDKKTSPSTNLTSPRPKIAKTSQLDSSSDDEGPVKQLPKRHGQQLKPQFLSPEECEAMLLAPLPRKHLPPTQQMPVPDPTIAATDNTLWWSQASVATNPFLDPRFHQMFQAFLTSNDGAHPAMMHPYIANTPPPPANSKDVLEAHDKQNGTPQETSNNTNQASKQKMNKEDGSPNKNVPKFHKMKPQDLYNPNTSKFALRFYPPASPNKAKEFESYEHLRLDVISRYPSEYGTFIDLMEHNINNTRDFTELFNAFHQHLRNTEPEEATNTKSSPKKDEPTTTDAHTTTASPTSSKPAPLSPGLRDLLVNQTASPSTSKSIASPTNNGVKKPVQVTVAKTLNNAMVLKVTKRGAPCFTSNVENYMRDHPAFTKTDLKVDFHSYIRDPNDIFCQFGVTTERGYTRRIFVCVHTLTGPNQFELNTASNRARWANSFVALYNSPTLQAEMRYPEQACFAADITPQDESKCAPLSSWLTAQDTLDYVVQTLKNYNNFTDILASDDVMSLFFSPADIPRVRAQLDPNAQTPNYPIDNGDKLDF